MAEEKIHFDERKAVGNWRKRYKNEDGTPDDDTIISILRGELEDCLSKPDRYKNTPKHIEDMLLRLGVDV